MEEWRTEIYAKVRALITKLPQRACQLTVPASQVQNRLIPSQHLEHTPDSRLDAVSRRRKRLAETSVKLPINFN